MSAWEWLGYGAAAAAGLWLTETTTKLETVWARDLARVARYVAGIAILGTAVGRMLGALGWRP